MWKFFPAVDEFDQMAGIWAELNKKNKNHILLDSHFVSLLLRYFGSPNVLLGVSTIDHLSGVILVEPVGGIRWQTFQPSQAPIGLGIFDCKYPIKIGMARLIRSLSPFALMFSVLQQDPDHTSFNCTEKDPCWEPVHYIPTARLVVSGTFEDYWRGRSKNLTHNLTRQQRRLNDQGIDIQLVIERDRMRMGTCLEEYARLEKAGWKAKTHTAIDISNDQGKFYREVLEYFACQGEAVVYRLQFNGSTVACDLCLERDGVLIILKTTYDESIKGCSPGLLLHRAIFESVFSEGRIKLIEFYGRVRDWHMKWTDQTRMMFHVNIYRYAWIASLRNSLKKTLIS